MFYLFLIFLFKLYSYLTFYIISLFFYKKTFVKLEKDIIFSLIIKPIEMYLKQSQEFELDHISNQETENLTLLEDKSQRLPRFDHPLNNRKSNPKNTTRKLKRGQDHRERGSKISFQGFYVHFMGNVALSQHGQLPCQKPDFAPTFAQVFEKN